MATATEAWADSPLLSDLHCQRCIIQTKAVLNVSEQNLNDTTPKYKYTTLATLIISVCQYLWQQLMDNWEAMN